MFLLYDGTFVNFFFFFGVINYELLFPCFFLIIIGFEMTEIKSATKGSSGRGKGRGKGRSEAPAENKGGRGSKRKR